MIEAYCAGDAWQREDERQAATYTRYTKYTRFVKIDELNSNFNSRYRLTCDLIDAECVVISHGDVLRSIRVAGQAP